MVTCDGSVTKGLIEFIRNQGQDARGQSGHRNGITVHLLQKRKDVDYGIPDEYLCYERGISGRMSHAALEHTGGTGFLRPYV